MLVFLVRHGESEPNTATRDWDLSLRGEHQARLTGHHLAQAGITHMVSSPLHRALSTAHIMAEILDYRPIDVWLDLREGCDDAYCGPSQEEVRARYPRAAVPAHMPVAGWTYVGESYASFRGRCEHLDATLTTQFSTDDRVVVVAHGGVLSYLLNTIVGVPVEAPLWFEMETCAISRVRFVSAQDQTAWPLYPAMTTEILSLNGVAHLHG